MLITIPWTVLYTDQAGRHAQKNVLGPSDIHTWSSKDVGGLLCIDGTVTHLVKGHHESIAYGVHDEQ